ncbi:hypothetical protein [Pantoea sp. Taur]|uniref:hypothetical protein n=1 Tax=Pantoea sp. Taur TaxID=2576757 RepID=UPI001370B573|nr:hypothetical protein [Pantoea sp. Taur]
MTWREVRDGRREWRPSDGLMLGCFVRREWRPYDGLVLVFSVAIDDNLTTAWR